MLHDKTQFFINSNTNFLIGGLFEAYLTNWIEKIVDIFEILPLYRGVFSGKDS